MPWKLPNALRRLARSCRRLGPLLPVAILAVACATGAMILSSCGEHPPTPGPVVFSAPPGVPTLRVLLTAAPVQSVSLSTTGPCELKLDGRTVMKSNAPLSIKQVTRAGRQWRLDGTVAEGSRLVLQPVGVSYLRAGTWLCRGEIHLLPAEETGLRIINCLDMESYLAGVLAKELLVSWSAETYGALAVAARTFALYHLRNTGPTRDYDVGCDQGWQVYGAMMAETDRAWKAVRATTGLVLACGPAGHEEIFLAQYSAACGGTVNGAYVIRNAAKIEPLMGGQQCDDCRPCRLYRWPPVRVAKRDFCRAVAAAYPAERELGDLEDVRVATETPYGRAVFLDLVGTNNTVRLRADDLRLALLRMPETGGNRIYSMNCRIRLLEDAVEFYDGRGFGHGVGLCQWGAEGKTQRGWSAQQILQFYYPGAKLMRAYGQEPSTQGLAAKG